MSAVLGEGLGMGVERCGDFGGVTKSGAPCRREVRHGGRCTQHGDADAPPSDPENVVLDPSDWDKAVSAAYLWLVTDTQRAAAKGAGVSSRTLRRWVHSEWWQKAVAEAKSRWLNHLTAQARRTLLRSIVDGDSDKALQVLQQFDDDFAPRPKRVEVVSAIAFIGTLPKPEVDRLMALPPPDRKDELLRLASASGVEIAE